MRLLLLCVCVGPAGVMALLGAATVGILLTAGISVTKTRLALIIFVVGFILILAAAAYCADLATRQVHERLARRAAGPPSDRAFTGRSADGRGGDDVRRRLAELESLIAGGQNDLRELVEKVKRRERVAPRGPDPLPATSDDPFARVTRAVHDAQRAAWDAVVDVAGPARAAGSDHRVEVFVNLARRLQSLSHRAITGLDDLENQVEDPDLLKGLFAVDHLTTRMRRQAESLAVIGGATSRRQWSRPVTLYEVLRSAVAEIEHYKRVKLVPPIEGTLDGIAVADVIHLLAELVENATKFAPPHTNVLLRTERVAAGVVIEVEDRGLGIPHEDQHRLNELLADADRIEIGELLNDGRIGLLVVSALSRRHGVNVQLRSNLFGGTQAIVVLPDRLVGAEPTEPTGQRPASRTRYEPAPATGSHVASAVPHVRLSGPGIGTTTASGRRAAARDTGEAVTGGGRPPLPRRRAGASPGSPDSHSRGPVEPLPGPPEAVPTAHAPANDGERPPLPTRPVQGSLAPGLRTSPTSRKETDAEHDPGLMAAFQKGIRSGQADDGRSGTESTG